MNHNQDIKTKTFFHPGFQGLTYLIVTCSFLFTSCARYYYAPNSANIPLLSEKEAKINVQYAAGTVSKGIECQSAFAYSPHFGGMINTMIGGSNNQGFDASSGKTNTSFIEIGTGYFSPLGSTSLVFETYGGIGTGGVGNKYYNGDKSKVTFTKLFLQPNIGVKVKGFEFGISSRMSWIKQKVVTNTVSSDQSPYIDLDDISERPESFLWEPGLVMRFGGEKFMAQLQYTAFVNLTNPDFQFLQEIGYFTLGFSIPLKYKTTGQ